MTTTQKNKCCARVFAGTFTGHTCGKTAKVERNGKWYCGIHDPVARAKKQQARDEVFLKGHNARLAAQSQAQAARKEADRKAACYDDLLGALKEIANSSPQDTAHFATRIALEAIAKAEGAPI